MEAKRSYKIGKKETKRDRFIRIVERRVNNLLNDFESLGKCSNKKNYEYNDDDVKKIFGEIEKKMKEIKLLYKNSEKRRNSFKLEP
jgi:hypothetical protein